MGEPRSVLRSATLTVLALGSFLLAVYFVVQPVQLHIWNHLNWTDLLVMTMLIAPFLASKWLLPPRSRITHVAWWLCALMALDVLALLVVALRGERVTTILLGTLCLIGETLYALGNPAQPLGWFAWLERASA